MKRKTVSFLLGVLSLSAAVMSAEGPTAERAHRAFEQLKALSGRWEAIRSDGERIEIAYELLQNGSVLFEKVYWRDMSQAYMVTAFHLDQENLVATHYCAGNNQPRLKAVFPEKEVVRFEFQGAGNMPDPRSGHIHGAVFRLADLEHFTSEWIWFQNGKADHTSVRKHTRPQ